MPLREKAQCLVGHVVSEPKEAPVFIKYDGEFLTSTQFDIYVDGERVCEAGDYTVHPSSLR